MHPETQHGGVRRGSSRQVGDLKGDRFTAETSERTGISERAVQRDAARGEKVASLSASCRVEGVIAKAIGARAAHKAMGHNIDDATANFAVAFTKDTAARTSISERTVRLDASQVPAKKAVQPVAEATEVALGVWG
jgi:hypothetical protein